MDEKQIRTLAEWNEIYIGIQSLMQESIPIKEGYWLARNADRVETVIKHLDKLRLKMLEEMADKDDEGKPIMLDTPGVQGRQFQIKENWGAFQTAWEEVINQEEEIEIHLLSLKAIGEKLEAIKPIILKSMLCLFTE